MLRARTNRVRRRGGVPEEERARGAPARTPPPSRRGRVLAVGGRRDDVPVATPAGASSVAVEVLPDQRRLVTDPSRAVAIALPRRPTLAHAEAAVRYSLDSTPWLCAYSPVRAVVRDGSTRKANVGREKETPPKSARVFGMCARSEAAMSSATRNDVRPFRGSRPSPSSAGRFPSTPRGPGPRPRASLAVSASRAGV